jgi:hypothetical protein
MSRLTRFVVIGFVAVLGGPGRSVDARGPAEDDLALVRRAVAQEEPAAARPETSPPPPKRAARKAEPQWLRVRIKDKGGKSAVSVNLPLALARALGDDVPFDWACHHKGDEGRAKIRLSDVLASLDSGQDIVQVDSEDGTVRVWVE